MATRILPALAIITLVLAATIVVVFVPGDGQGMYLVVLAPVALFPRYWVALAVSLIVFGLGVLEALNPSRDDAAFVLRQSTVALLFNIVVMSAIVYLRKRFPLKRPSSTS